MTLRTNKSMTEAARKTTMVKVLSEETKKRKRESDKDAKAFLSRGKKVKGASRQLKAAVGTTVRQLAEQEEALVARVHAEQHGNEADVSLDTATDSMESAKNLLEATARTLAELLRQLEANVTVEKYERILNETASRLLVLRGSVESPALSGKIQKLRGAAEEQHRQMSQLDQSLREIRAERDSLTDIAQNLPKACPQKGH